MIIKKLELHNFQCIEDFSCDFDGNIYFITGDNERGKSTILKAIGMLLGVESGPVLKKGTDKGFAKMVIGADGREYHVSLNFTEKNPNGKISITAPDGMKSENKSMLQSIFSYQDFDAVEFSRWSETAEGKRKQIAVVKKLLPENVQKKIDEIDAKIPGLYAKRTDANSSLKTLTTIFETAASKLNDGDLKKYKSPVDVVELTKAVTDYSKATERAQYAKNSIKERTEQLDAMPDRIQAINEELERAKEAHKKALEEINAEIVDIKTKIENANKFLVEYEKAKPKEDPGVKLSESKLHNEKNVIVNDYLEKQKQMKAAEKLSISLDDQIKSLNKERKDLIDSSELPIQGLSFNEDGLQLNGIPFVAGKVSDSQIMEVAAKLIIASNPNTKVFRIARGESLGKERLEAIVKIAKDNGFQGFIEEVKRGQDELIVEEYEEAKK